MFESESPEPDWNALLESWDQQQDGCIPNRQSKFEAMLDVRARGIFLNGDVLPWGEGRKTLGKIAEKLRFARYGTLEVEFAPWYRWLEEAEREQKSLGPAFRQRKERFAHSPVSEGMLPVEFHMRLLRSAGFSEVGTMWQGLLQDQVLAAVR